MFPSDGSVVSSGHGQKKVFGWCRRHHLLIILLSVTIKGFFIATLVPSWHIHDEPAHVQYVQSMVEDRRLPIFRGLTQDLSQEISNSLQRSAKFGKLYAQLTPTVISPPADDSTNTRRMNSLPAANLAAEYGPLYYGIEAIAYVMFYPASIEHRLLAMRIFSSLLFVITVYYTYQLARLFRSSPWFASAAALMVGWQPQAAFIMSGVNNDALFVMLSTMCLFRFTKMLSGVMTSRDIVLTSVLVGLTIMTKQPGWIFFPLFLGIIGLRRKAFHRQSWMKWLGLAALIMTVVGSSWLLRQEVLGLSSGSIGSAQDISTRFQGQSISFYFEQIFVERWLKVFVTFWGFFGWSWSNPGPLLPIWVYRGLIGFSALGLVGLVRFFLVSKEAVARRGAYVLSAAWVLLEGLYILLFIHRLVFQGKTSFPTQGRYYFPLLAGLIILFLLGGEKLVPKQYQKIVWTVLPAGMILLGVYALYPIMWQHYHLPS